MVGNINQDQRQPCFSIYGEFIIIFLKKLVNETVILFFVVLAM